MIIVIILIATLIILKTILYKPGVDYKCYMLTTDKHGSRARNFLNTYDHTIPLEIVEGSDTRTPESARTYKQNVDPKYYRQALKLYHDKTAIRPNITYFNLGAIGCYAGHMKIYDKCFNSRYKYALVFEDNVVITNRKFFDEVQSVIDELGDDFELCFFHCLSRYPASDTSKTGLELVKWISSTKCYLINVENMKNYIHHFEIMDNHIDMKHEDIIFHGARVYYKDLRHCMLIDRSHKSLIGHSDWENKEFFSKKYPDATTDILEKGY
jgi:hypothetical protein